MVLLTQECATVDERSEVVWLRMLEMKRENPTHTGLWYGGDLGDINQLLFL